MSRANCTHAIVTELKNGSGVGFMSAWNSSLLLSSLEPFTSKEAQALAANAGRLRQVAEATARAGHVLSKGRMYYLFLK